MIPPSSIIREIVLGIIFIFILIRLFPHSRDVVLKDPFLLAHTLDPDYYLERDYNAWKAARWLTWLNEREPLHERAANRRRKYRLHEKPVNTVLIASPTGIMEAYRGQLDIYNNRYVWSNSQFISFVFVRRNDGSYKVVRCPPTFAAVALDENGKPVHLEGHSDLKVTSGNINYQRKGKCIELL